MSKIKIIWNCTALVTNCLRNPQLALFILFELWNSDFCQSSSMLPVSYMLKFLNEWYYPEKCLHIWTSKLLPYGRMSILQTISMIAWKMIHLAFRAYATSKSHRLWEPSEFCRVQWSSKHVPENIRVTWYYPRDFQRQEGWWVFKLKRLLQLFERFKWKCRIQLINFEHHWV